MAQKPKKIFTSKRIATSAGIVLLGVIASAAGMAVAVSHRPAVSAGVIAKGVVVGGVPVGGLTPVQAHERVRAWAQHKMQTAVTLSAPISKRRWHITVADLGGRFAIDPAINSAVDVGKQDSFWDTAIESVRGSSRRVTIQPKFEFSENLLDRRLKKIAASVHKSAKNARAALGSTGSLEVTIPETKGVDLDIDATKAVLLSKGPSGLLAGSETPLVITETKPTVTAADLGRVNSLLSSFHTSYSSSSENRAHNVELAASHIDGTLLAPGEIFSYNDIVGPREPKLGWLDAPTYQDGQVVPGPGGGVCQVSTTLYNAVLRAGFKVVQRSHHSMPVHYVEAGRDATVAYGDIDFKFQNDTDGPVLMVARAAKGKLSFNLYGKPVADAKKIDLESSPRTPTADGGFRVTTYRITTGADGVATKEALSTDSYMPYVPAAKFAVKPKAAQIKRIAKPKKAAPAESTPAPGAAAPDVAPPIVSPA